MSDEKKIIVPRPPQVFNTAPGQGDIRLQAPGAQKRTTPMTQGQATLSKVAETVQQLKGWTEQAIVSLLNTISNNGRDLAERQSNLALHVRRIDYRSLSIFKLLVSKGIVTEEELNNLAEELQTKDFEEQSAIQDQQMKLEVAAPDVKAEAGHIVIFGVQSVVAKMKKLADGTEVPNPNAGKDFPPLCIFRHKIRLGKEKVVPSAIQDRIVGLKVGESSTFLLPLNPNEPESDIYEVTVRLYGIRIEPPKQESETSAVVPTVVNPETPAENAENGTKQE